MSEVGFSDSSIPLRPTARVGGFLLEKKLDEDNLGSHWEAEEVELGRRVALRFLAQELASDPEQASRFKKEANAAARLRHPAFVRLHGIEEKDGHLFMVQELVPGRRNLYADFEERNRAGWKASKTTCSDTVKRFLVLAEGLAVAHKAGIVHRNISPRNLHLDEDGSLRLADFGMAMVGNQEEWSAPTGSTAFEMTGAPGTSSSANKGGGKQVRPYYVSPEQTMADREGLDHRADIFSLATVLYEALCGERAFDGPTVSEVLLQVSAGNPFDDRTIKKKVPADLLSILEHALEKKPGDRYQDMESLAADLQAFLAKTPVAAHKGGLGYRGKLWVRRHPAVTVGSGLAAASLLVGIPIWSEWSRSEAEVDRLAQVLLMVQARSASANTGSTNVVPALDTPAPMGKLWMVAIGVSNYQDDSLDLDAPVKDVDALIGCFRGHSGKGEMFSDIEVIRLVNEEVNSGSIVEARHRLAKEANTNDTILVFIAGHGVRAFGDYYFLTSDATMENPGNGISGDAINKFVTWDRILPTRRLLLYDTCQSGESVGGTRGVEPILAEEELRNVASEGSGIYIIAASTSQGLARENPGQGVFTAGILEGMKGLANMNQDSYISVDELKSFVMNYVREATDGAQKVTVPRVEAGEGFYLGFISGS